MRGARQAQKNAFAFKRCRSAFQKRIMTDESPRTKPEKLPKTKTELEALILAELRAASQCGGAVHVTVVAEMAGAAAPQMVPAGRGCAAVAD